VESREFAKSCFVALFGEIAHWVFVCGFLLCVQGDNLTLPMAAVCETIKT